MKVLQCCSTELAAPGRHASVLKRHTKWSFYQFRWCCSTELAAPDRHAAVVPLFYHRCVGLDGAAVLDMQHLTHMVQKYCDIATKCCKIRNCEKYMGCGGRFPTCNCSIILHKMHFLKYLNIYAIKPDSSKHSDQSSVTHYLTLP